MVLVRTINLYSISYYYMMLNKIPHSARFDLYIFSECHDTTKKRIVDRHIDICLEMIVIRGNNKDVFAKRSIRIPTIGIVREIIRRPPTQNRKNEKCPKIKGIKGHVSKRSTDFLTKKVYFSEKRSIINLEKTVVVPYL